MTEYTEQGTWESMDNSMKVLGDYLKGASMKSSMNKHGFDNVPDYLIKEAVEALFKVKVKAVNTIRVQGKTKRFKGVMGKRNDFKKAIITLVEGETIDVTTGL